MALFNMSEEEKSKIREQHNKATKEFFDKINSNKKGLQKPVEDKPVVKTPVKPPVKKIVPKKK